MSLFYPFEIFARFITYKVFSIQQDSLLGNALEFFIADIIKIFILLSVLIFLSSLIRSYIPKEKTQKFLSEKKRFLGYFFASLLGIITPFCSCSAIPLFLSFIETGIPVGMSFTFLIASPMINEVALILLLGLFGIKIASIYIVSGMIISIISGMILTKIKAEKWIMKDILIKDFLQKKCNCSQSDNFKNKLSYSKRYTYSILKKIWLYVFIGIGLGAFIHGYVPDDFLAKYADASKWYDVPLATLIGIPLYSNAAGVIPLISSLTEKGLSIGAALAFMMSITALSLPEFMILKRIMKWKLILFLALTVGCGIMIIGYLFNFILS